MMRGKVNVLMSGNE